MSRDKSKSATAIDHLRELLEQGRPQDALKFIDHLGRKDREMENARGVCLMRLGKVEEAVSVLRDVAFGGFVCMPADSPALYQVNFATAMLLANQKDAAIPVLDKLKARKCPEAAKVGEAVQRWYKSLNVFRRCCCRMGFYPRRPVTLDFQPGEI